MKIGFLIPPLVAALAFSLVANAAPRPTTTPLAVLDKPGRWELRRGFFSVAVDILEDFAGTALPESLKTTLEADGDMKDFILWLEKDEIRPQKRMRFWTYRRRLHHAAVRPHEINKLEAWVETQKDLAILETKFKVSIPFEIRAAFIEGFFVDFEEWVMNNNIRVEKNEWTQVRNILRRAGGSRTLIARLESVLTATGSVTASSKWTSMIVTSETVTTMERHLKIKIPVYIEEGMIEGNFKLFSIWFKAQGIKIRQRMWSSFIRALEIKGVSKETIEGLESWYVETGGEGTDESKGVQWKQLKLTQTEIFEVESVIGTSIPMEIQEKILVGEFGSFSKWVVENNIRISETTFQSLIVKLTKSGVTSKTIEGLQTWFVKLSKENGGTTSTSIEQASKETDEEGTTSEPMESTTAEPESGENGSEEKTKEKSNEKTKEKSNEKTKEKSNKKTKEKSNKKTKEKSNEKTKERSNSKTNEKSNEKTKEKSNEKTKEKSNEKTKEKSNEKTKENSNEKTKEKSNEKTKEKSNEKTKEKSNEKTKEKSNEKTKEKSNEKTKEKSNEKTKEDSGEKETTSVSWRKMQLNRRQINILRKFTSKFSRNISRKLKKGDFEAFSIWMKKNYVTITESQFKRMITSFVKKTSASEVSVINRLKTWFVQTGGNGGPAPASKESEEHEEKGTTSKVEWTTIKLTKAQIKVVSQLIKTISSSEIPKETQKKMRNRNFKAFSVWMKKAGVTITNENFSNLVEVLRKKNVSTKTIEGLVVWFEKTKGKGGVEKEDEKESGEKGTNPKSEEEKSTESEWKFITLTRKEISILEQVIDAEIPSSIKQSLTEGDFLAFSKWMKENRIEITNINTLTLRMNMAGIFAENVNKLEEWYVVTNGKGGSGGSGTGSLAVDKEGISELESVFLPAGRQIPTNIQRKLESGALGAFFTWLSAEKIEITESQVSRLKRNAGMVGISNAVVQMFKSYEGSHRSLSVEALMELQLLANGFLIPDNLKAELRRGKYASFFVWLQHDDIKFTHSNWEYFEEKYESLGISSQFFELMSTYFEIAGVDKTVEETEAQKRLRKFEAEFLGDKQPPTNVYLASLAEGHAVLVDFTLFAKWLSNEKVHISSQTWLWFVDNYAQLGIERKAFEAIRSWYWEDILEYPGWVGSMLKWAKAANGDNRSEEKFDTLTIQWSGFNSIKEILSHLELDRSQQVMDFIQIRTGRRLPRVTPKPRRRGRGRGRRPRG